MTEKKLRDYLATRFDNPTTQKILIPVVLSDSKGDYLKNVVTYNSNIVESSIVWWCTKGATVQNRVEWLRTNLANKITLLGQIHLYVWCGTCNLTNKDKNGSISLAANPTETVEQIISQYREIVNLVQQFPGSKVTFLDTPIYSIVTYNQTRAHHPEPYKFEGQDRQLLEAIVTLNEKTEALNREHGVYSPNLNRCLYTNSKRRSFDRQALSTKRALNLKFFTDGIHPNNLLSRVWLRKLAKQIVLDCWL